MVAGAWPALTWLRTYRNAAFVVLCIAFAATHFLALFTDAFNWDEFALLHRAQHAVLTGELQTGGRPGLGVIVLIPFVDGCEHHTKVLVAARMVWCLITLSLVAGAFELFRRATRSWHAALLGVAAFALVPLFLRWSLQVRTDQPAVALAMWSGVALLVSRDRARWSIVAGLLLGIGYLFSQKAVYIGALVGLVAVGQHYIAEDFQWRRELKRAAGLGVGVLVAIGLYRVVVPLVYSPPRAVSLEVGLDLFKWYKAVLRYRLYPSMLTSVLPQLGLLVLVFVAALRSFRQRTKERRSLLVALAVMLLGYAIGRFHTASFPYFWITIGVFPATAITFGWKGVRAMLPRASSWIAGAAAILMVLLAIRYRAETLHDTQTVQRDSFAFVEQLPRGWRGFHTDGALVCRNDPAPFKVYLGQDIQRRLFGAGSAARRREFISEFGSRPVAYLVRTQRFSNFPEEIKKFWKTHYVAYAGPVELAGRSLEGTPGTVISIEIIVAGAYRWHSQLPITVDGRHVAANGTVDLAAGAHRVTLVSGADGESLVLAVPMPPRPSDTPFYAKILWGELSGLRRDWW
jgi:hypothetical protein